VKKKLFLSSTFDGGKLGVAFTDALVAAAVIVVGHEMLDTINGAGVTSAAAQGVYLEGPGFGVGIGRPAYRERHYRGYYDYAASFVPPGMTATGID
jgi:hypothetical protein